MDVAWVDQLSVTYLKVVVLATYEMCTQALQMNDEIVDMCMLLDYENRHDLWVDLGSSWCLAISLCLKTSAVWSQYRGLSGLGERAEKMRVWNIGTSVLTVNF